MKPSPRYDFLVSVRLQAWEEEPEIAPLYQGIIEVTLNHTLSIIFVPEFERNANCCHYVLPDNVDKITTDIEARLVSVALSKYSVTPNPSLAGLEEIISRVICETPERGVIFYVTPEEFKIFSSELSMLSEQLPSVHSSRPASEIENLEVTKFLLSRILTSKYFAEEDLQMLGRMDTHLTHQIDPSQQYIQYGKVYQVG
ncbi:MAG: hypothetical protein SAK29_32745 [Scytonema sp. PMC 1069.18]|nr:hypothetical protein [Scytonema sp. PMC 1069.18]MEC4885638.1 hypothetical protein [Scytonema sp. PMC 1070.18]